jgi:riboflavin-specific deaminase-like protein
MSPMQQLYPPADNIAPDDDVLQGLYAWPEQPWLRSNMVVTLDGAIRDSHGRSSGLSNASDRKVLNLLRATCSAYIIGAGTVSAEDLSPPRLYPTFQEVRRAAGLPERPVLVIVSNSLSIDPSARVFQGEPGTTVILTNHGADPERVTALSRVSEVVKVGDDHVDLPGAIEMLQGRGWTRLLTEGGPKLLGEMLPLVDEFCLSISPQIMGATQPAQVAPDVLGGARYDIPMHFMLHHLLVADDMLIGSWRRQLAAQP